ncbi:MAG: hypothetical protein L0Y54_20825 [Sporichthyaceae bacterium]|nr:hypothetical protein [Sporichthyaceae bacterium]
MNPPIVGAELQTWLIRLALYHLHASVEADYQTANRGGCHDCRSARGRFGPTVLCRTHRDDRALLNALHATYTRLADGTGPDPWQDRRWRTVLLAHRPETVQTIGAASPTRFQDGLAPRAVRRPEVAQ